MLRIQYFGEFQGVYYSVITHAHPRAYSPRPASAWSSETGCVAGEGYLWGGGRGTGQECGAGKIERVCTGRGGNTELAFSGKASRWLYTQFRICQRGKKLLFSPFASGDSTRQELCQLNRAQASLSSGLVGSTTSLKSLPVG